MSEDREHQVERIVVVVDQHGRESVPCAGKSLLGHGKIHFAKSRMPICAGIVGKWQSRCCVRYFGLGPCLHACHHSCHQVVKDFLETAGPVRNIFHAKLFICKNMSESIDRERGRCVGERDDSGVLSRKQCHLCGEAVGVAAVADHFHAAIDVREPAKAVFGALEFFKIPEIGRSDDLWGMHFPKVLFADEAIAVDDAAIKVKEGIFCHVRGSRYDCAGGGEGAQVQIRRLDESAVREDITFGSFLVLGEGLDLEV